jgi:hypothetical protein
MPTNSMSWWAFSCTNFPKLSLHEPIQQVLINTGLSYPVASCAGWSMSHVWHMESDVLFPKRSCRHRAIGAAAFIAWRYAA